MAEKHIRKDDSMKSQMMFGEKKVWIKTNGDVEIRDGKGVTTHHINCDYRIEGARERLMEGTYKSIDDIVRRIDMANTIDKLVDSCQRFLIFGVAYNTGVLCLNMAGGRNLLMGFNRYGLDAVSYHVDIIDYPNNKVIHYCFDKNDSSTLVNILLQFSTYTPADESNILSVIEISATKVEEGEIPELMKVKTA